MSPSNWTPDQTLRADATSAQLSARHDHFWCQVMSDEAWQAVIREYAAARVADCEAWGHLTACQLIAEGETIPLMKHPEPMAVITVRQLAARVKELEAAASRAERGANESLDADRERLKTLVKMGRDADPPQSNGWIVEQILSDGFRRAERGAEETEHRHKCSCSCHKGRPFCANCADEHAHIVLDAARSASRPEEPRYDVEPCYQGKREDQVTFSYLVTSVCFGVLVVLLIGWGIIAWGSR